MQPSDLAHSCCFTGHRPEKLRRPVAEVRDNLHAAIAQAVEDGYSCFLSGMARGVDLWAAQLVLEAKQEYPHLALFCVLPFPDGEKQWSAAWQQLYWRLLAQADGVHTCREHFSYDAYRLRNQWLVDHASRLIVAYNGSSGGTLQTLNYAQKRGRQIHFIPC